MNEAMLQRIVRLFPLAWPKGRGPEFGGGSLCKGKTLRDSNPFLYVLKNANQMKCYWHGYNVS